MSTVIRTEAGDRPVPFTQARAATELVRCRHSLRSARGSLELVLAIIDRLEPPPNLPATELEEILGSLEETEAALRQLMFMADPRS